jgi:HK97 gp10 family phage protein
MADDLKSLLRALDAIPQAAKNAISDSLTKGADEMAARMVYLAPKGKTGNLVKSIRKVRVATNHVRVEAGGKLTTKPVRNGQTATFDYALGVEYGTADSGSSPFFWPSVNTTKKRVRRRVDRAVSKAAREAFK